MAFTAESRAKSKETGAKKREEQEAAKVSDNVSSKGYIRNGEITLRDGQTTPLFVIPPTGNVYTQLDGYKITSIEAPNPVSSTSPNYLPLSEYSLTGSSSNGIPIRIKTPTDAQVWIDSLLVAMRNKDVRHAANIPDCVIIADAVLNLYQKKFPE